MIIVFGGSFKIIVKHNKEREKMTSSSQQKSPQTAITPVPFARKLLASGIASILVSTAGLTVITPSAFAQQSDTTKEAELIEEIEVSGIRFSQRSAQDRKKAAETTPNQPSTG